MFLLAALIGTNMGKKLPPPSETGGTHEILFSRLGPMVRAY
jgi:hypothetical protein